MLASGPIDSVSTLIEQVRAGSQHAARTLFGDYNGYVLRAIYKRLPVDDPVRRLVEARDIEQDVWCRAFRAIGRGENFTCRTNLVAFLVSLSQRECVMAIRRAIALKRSVHQEQPLDAARVITSGMPDPAELAADALDWETCLEREPENHRTALLLWREGYSVTEIARIVQVSPRTVERIIERARKWWNRRAGGE